MYSSYGYIDIQVYIGSDIKETYYKIYIKLLQWQSSIWCSALVVPPRSLFFTPLPLF